MKIRLARLYVGISLFAFGGQIGGQINASDPDTLKQATALVGQAIQSEIDGDLVSRDRLLKEACHLDSEFAPARWLQGQVKSVDGKWTSVEESVTTAQSNRLLAEYESMRSRQPASVEGNWQAAQWCAKNGMMAQCRAHLENIIVLDHDNKAARAALGHQLVGHDWVSPADQARLVQRAAFASLGREKYGQGIEKLALKISSGSGREQDAALKEMFAIDDPLVIPVLESLAGKSTLFAMIATKRLTEIDHPESSLALMRLAVLYPDDQVTNLAIEGLKKKPLHDFVPEMLSAMSSQILSMTIPVFDSHGEFAGFRQSFAKEEMDEVRTLNFDSQLVTQMVGLPVSTPGGLFRKSSLKLLARNPNMPYGQRNTWGYTTEHTPIIGSDPNEAQAFFEQAKLLEQMTKLALAASVQDRQVRVAKENEQINRINRRIATVLSHIVDVEFATVPRDVWSWWDRYNETAYQQTKYHRRQYGQLAFAAPRPYTIESPNFGSTKTEFHVYKASCFVAGTKINTLRGLKAIESIMPGDMVLSCDIRTGELGYKPVICGTNRDPAKTVILKVDDEIIHATTGHLLWVCGKGWVKAGEIKVGELLHTSAEPAVVVSSSPGPELPTHNLIIADTHNYFVGTSRLLSHDVLPRGAIEEQVPGQLMLTVK